MALITTVGYSTWTVPNNVSSVTIQCIGPGANGTFGTSGRGGDGGGGGSYAKSIINVSPGQILYLSIGTSSNGMNTWVNTTNTAPTTSSTGCLAYRAVGQNGQMSYASIGQIVYDGGNGGSHPVGGGGPSGGGGGAGGPYGAGTSGGTRSGTLPLEGGWGGPAGGLDSGNTSNWTIGNTTSNGPSGASYYSNFIYVGSGGAGAPSGTSTFYSGGNGGNYGGGGGGALNGSGSNSVGVGSQGVVAINYVVDKLFTTSITSFSTIKKTPNKIYKILSRSFSTLFPTALKSILCIALSNSIINKKLIINKLRKSSSTAISKFVINKRFWAFLWSMIYATDKWIGVKRGTSIAATSVDGVDWSTTSLPSNSSWAAIAYGATTAVTVAANSDKAASSTDGLTWAARTLPVSKTWTSIAANSSTFVTVSLDSNKCATSIDNGATWTEYSLPQYSNWTSVTYGNGLFVAVGDSGIAATSPDGIAWTSRAMPDSLQFNSVTWANNQFTAVASGPTNLAAKSADGITWSRIYMPSAQNWTAVGPGVGNPNV